ncbi:MAG TPA: hypothetical protein VFT74_11040, partial [Isosphaeraceae bacterium]|nr:hypothetical protein [Isosphaeraceae bacterium]
DRLLRVDHRLAVSLDGVYRRAEVYLRVLQKSSSIAFGTWLGRMATLFLIIPFVGAFVTLEGLTHLIEPVHAFLTHSHQRSEALANVMLSTATLDAWRIGPSPAPWERALARRLDQPIHLVSARSVLALGVLILLMVHAPWARRLAWTFLRTLGQILKGLLFDLPSGLMRLPIIEWILSSRLARLVWHWLIAPSLAGLSAGLIAWVLEHHSDLAYLIGAGTFLFVITLLNSGVGRSLEEEAIEQVSRSWNRLHADLLPGLYRVVMSFFDRMLETIDRILYTVDEWLRFRSGERQGTLAVKAVLGALWFVITYLTRLVVNLLVEPQVNPIKHFPVVTVAHKITLPFMLELLRFLMGPPFYVNPVTANGLVFTMQMLLPGVFGFLIWELKENWKLYEANRAKSLRPVPVGHHGETLARLLRPGFHSGTIPKLFDHLRRAGRKARESGQVRKIHKDREALRHVEQAVRHFLDREFLALLQESPTLRDLRVKLGQVVLATNRIRFELLSTIRPGVPFVILFEEQSGWIVASVAECGWLDDLEGQTRLAFSSALSGLYKKGAVNLVREQVRLSLEPPTAAYDIGDDGLVAWLPGRPEASARLDLSTTHATPRQPADTLPTALHPRIVADRLSFGHTSISWNDWVELWVRDEAGQPPSSLLDTGEVLPEREPVSEPARSSPASQG